MCIRDSIAQKHLYMLWLNLRNVVEVKTGKQQQKTPNYVQRIAASHLHADCIGETIDNMLKAFRQNGDTFTNRSFPNEIACLIHLSQHSDTSSAEVIYISLIHISEPTRLGMISYAVFC